MANSLWTRDEMILILNLFLKTPFGKMHKSNPEVIKMAQLIGRTPDAVVFRLGNYASLDPQLKQRGISGLSHTGKKCKECWNEFVNNREELLFESERILALYEGSSIEKKYKNEIKGIPSDITGETKIQQIKSRVNQNVFRQIVLANYENQCALTGIDIPELLVASHIIPWSQNEQERINPENGICLSSLYDKAFDQGLISFDNNLKVIFSERLQSNVGKAYYDNYFRLIKGKSLAETKKYTVNLIFLEWHRDCIFNKVL